MVLEAGSVKSPIEEEKKSYLSNPKSLKSPKQRILFNLTYKVVGVPCSSELNR